MLLQNNLVMEYMPCEPSCDAAIRGYRESHIDEKISCIIGLQIRSTFYKVETGLMALLKNCLELESGNSTSILSGYVDHFQSIESEDVGWGCGWRNIQMLSSRLCEDKKQEKFCLVVQDLFLK